MEKSSAQDGAPRTLEERRLKRVLVVDDELLPRNDLRHEFEKYSLSANGAFTFKLDTASTIEEALAAIRARRGEGQYDVLVLDLAFGAETDRSGLSFAVAFGLYRRLGEEVPVVIVCSGFTEMRYCVHTMRCGAWDMIDKRVGETDGKNAYAQVVASAVSRLQALDLQNLLNVVAVKWVQEHVTELQTRYGGQVVAIWHEPYVDVVAAGKDVFDLEIQLEAWRRERPEWMYPFIVRIPETTAASESNGAWR